MIEIVEPIFYFSGLNDDLSSSLDEHFLFTKLSNNRFSIENAIKESAGNTFFLRYHTDSLILDRLPLTGDLGEEINLCLYDISKNTSRLERLN